MAANVVREALHTFARPDVAVKIIARALHLAQEVQIPQGGNRLRVFVDHHLFAATRFVIDEPTAEALLLQLRPLLERIPTVEPEEPSAAAQAIDEATGVKGFEEANDELSGVLRTTDAAPVERTVLVATENHQLLQHLQERIEATFLWIEDIVALLDNVEMLYAPPVVIVDGQHATVQPTTLATMGEDLPDGTEIVLYAVDPMDEESARALVDDPDRWYSCAAQPEALEALVGQLLHL